MGKEGLHFNSVLRIIDGAKTNNLGMVLAYTKKLKEQLLKEGYEDDAKILQLKIDELEGKPVARAVMD